MARAAGPWTVVGWLGAQGTDGALAGAAFLIGSDIALTCAHVVRDHLGLGSPTPAEPPIDRIRVRFEALDREVSGQVLAKGWFPDSASTPDGLSDIAVIRLDNKVDGITIPAIARNIPNQRFDGLVFGAGPGYEDIGQEAQVKISGNPNIRGWRKLDAEPIGFSVKRGFSGAPVMDELGNTVWGMIATVDAAGERVSFAITAEDLRQAMRTAGAASTTGVRIEDEADVNARQAMIALREQVAGMEVESQQKQQEIARLQEMVRSFEQRERSTPGTGPEGRALRSLAEGDARPATEILRERIRQQRADAAAAGRQLGTLLSLTNSADALNAYREAALLDPDDFWTLIELGKRERWAGSLSLAAGAFQRAYNVAERAAEADPESTRRQRDLSVGGYYIGDVRMAEGDRQGALGAYQKYLETATRLAEADPLNTEWQRDLSIGHNKIGNVHMAEGHRLSALDAYQKSLEIRTRLAEADPHDTQWQRDLSVSHDNIGNVRIAEGDRQGALDAYEKSLEIAACLTQTDPHNTDWQRDLSVSHNNIGDVRLALGDLQGALETYQTGLEIRTRLVETDPFNTEWQRDLSISHEKIGDVRMAEGDPQSALDAYQKSLQIRTRLTETDLQNTQWQRDLSISHDKIGNVGWRRTTGKVLSTPTRRACRSGHVSPKRTRTTLSGGTISFG